MSNGPIQKGGDKVKVEYPLKQGLKRCFVNYPNFYHFIR